MWCVVYRDKLKVGFTVQPNNEVSPVAEEEEGNSFKHHTYGSNSGSTCFISIDTFPRWSSIGGATTEFYVSPGCLMKFLAFFFFSAENKL